jgi:DNA-binding response OmpR family regulator
LRAQIEEDPARPQYLETVRGVGYVLRRPEGD